MAGRANHTQPIYAGCNGPMQAGAKLILQSSCKESAGKLIRSFITINLVDCTCKDCRSMQLANSRFTALSGLETPWVWSVDAEDGKGFQWLYSVRGASRVPVPMYLVIHTAIGGIGGGGPDPASFPQTFKVDYVRVSQPATEGVRSDDAGIQHAD
jgi:hypothetical protein